LGDIKEGIKGDIIGLYYRFILYTMRSKLPPSPPPLPPWSPIKLQKRIQTKRKSYQDINELRPVELRPVELRPVELLEKRKKPPLYIIIP
jgi:hypothetical protein